MRPMPTNQTPVALLIAIAACCAAGCREPGPPCASTSDCCDHTPSSLCTGEGTCEPNIFCADDPRCFGSRFGQCGGGGETCGNGVCAGGETCGSCSVDCGTCSGPRCGDAVCDLGESCGACPADCTCTGGPCALQSHPFCGADSTSGSAPSIELGLRHHVQHTDVWCWAAVSSSATDYLRGVMGEDCQFLSAYFAALGTPVDCCFNPGACYRAGMSMSEIQYALSIVGGIQSHLEGAPISECMLRQELANGRPVIIGFLNSFSGHVAIISGYDETGFHVQDPYHGERWGVPYATLVSPGLGYYWADTIHHLATTPLCR